MSHIIDRVRKLLKLAEYGTENEAALAATRAAELMAEHALTEAIVRLEDPRRPAEAIIEGARVDPTATVTRKRVAWKEAVASGVADSLGLRTWIKGHDMVAFGRESATQTWGYTTLYLCAEIERLCTEAWNIEGDDAKQAGQNTKAWKNAFRIGAARRVSKRLREKASTLKTARVQARQAAVDSAAKQSPDSPCERQYHALVLVDKDQQEVDSEYSTYAKRHKFRSAGAVGRTSSRSGYEAGSSAGDQVSLGGGRGGLGAGRGVIGGGS